MFSKLAAYAPTFSRRMSHHHHLYALTDFLSVIDKSKVLNQGNTFDDNIPVSDSIDARLDKILCAFYDYDEDMFNDIFHRILMIKDRIMSCPFDRQHGILFVFESYLKDGDLEDLYSIIHYFIYLIKPILSNNPLTIKKILSINRKLCNQLFHKVIDISPQDDNYEEQMFKFFADVGSTTSNIKDTTDNILNASRTLPDMMQSAAAATASVNSVTERLATTADNLKTFVTGMMTPLPFNVGSIIENAKRNWLGLSACVASIYRSDNLIDLLLAILPMPSLLGLDTSCSQLLDVIKNKVFGSVQEQGDFSNSKKMLCLLLSCMGRYSPSSMVGSFTTGLSNSVKDMVALDKLWEIFSDVLSEWGFDISSKAQTVAQLRADIASVVQATVFFETMVATKTAFFCIEKEYSNFMKNYNKVQSMKIQVDSGVYSSIKNSNFCADLMNLNTRYISMKRIIDECRSTTGTRQEPVALVFTGVPGIGKTQLMGVLLKRIVKLYKSKYADNPKYDFMEDVEYWTTWFQNTRDQYHEGFNGQEVHGIDDLFSVADQSDHNDMINFISGVNFGTRQADLPRKGLAYKCKLLIASANQFALTSKVLMCVQALHRRFTVVQCDLREPGVMPTGDMDLDFKHLKLSMYSGLEYADHLNGTWVSEEFELKDRELSLDNLCDYIIQNMYIKHCVFASTMEFNKCEQAPYVEPEEVVEPKLKQKVEREIITPLKYFGNELYNNLSNYLSGTYLDAKDKLESLKEIHEVEERKEKLLDICRRIKIKLNRAANKYKKTLLELRKLEFIEEWRVILKEFCDACLLNFEFYYFLYEDVYESKIPDTPPPVQNEEEEEEWDDVLPENIWDDIPEDVMQEQMENRFYYNGEFQLSDMAMLANRPYEGPTGISKVKDSTQAPEGIVINVPNVRGWSAILTELRDRDRSLYRYMNVLKIEGSYPGIIGTYYLKEYITLLETKGVIVNSMLLFMLLRQSFVIGKRDIAIYHAAYVYNDDVDKLYLRFRTGNLVKYYNPISHDVVNNTDPLNDIYRTPSEISAHNYEMQPWYQKAWKMVLCKYTQNFDTLLPLLRNFAILGKVIGVFVCPMYSIISSVLALGLTKLYENHNGTNDCAKDEFAIFLLMSIQAAHLIPYIGIISAVGAAILYKYKTFSITDLCDKCLGYNTEAERKHKAFCKERCGTGKHVTSCLDFINCYHYILELECESCKTDKCEGSCLHNISKESVRKSSMVDVKTWYLNGLHVQEMKANRHKPQYSNESAKQQKIHARMHERDITYYSSLNKGHRYKHEHKAEILDVDILSVDETIMQCVSADFVMSAGLAMKIKKKYPAIKDMEKCNVGESSLFKVANGNYIVNLVTKQHYKNKPTIGQFTSSLRHGLDQLVKLKIDHVAIPEKIGCVRDKLDWNVVQGIIKDECASRKISYDYTSSTVPQPQELKEEYETLLEEYDNTHTPGAAKPAIDVKMDKARVHVEEITHDAASLDVMVSMMKMSLSVHRMRDGVTLGKLRGTPFKKYVITPSHLHVSSDPSLSYAAEINGKLVPLRLLKAFPKRDVALWKIDDISVNPFSNSFYKQLISEADFLRVACKTIVALQHLPKKNIVQMVEVQTVKNAKVDIMSEKDPRIYDRLFSIRGMSSLSPATADGDCGGLIVMYDNKFTRKILGFHVLGGARFSYSSIITKEDVDEMLRFDQDVHNEEIQIEEEPYLINQNCSKYPIVDFLNLIPDEIVGQISRDMPSGDFEYLGETADLHKAAGQSSILKHPFHGEFEVTGSPAILMTDDLLDEHEVALDQHGKKNLLVARATKYGKVFKSKIDNNILSDMTKQLINHFRNVLDESDLSVSTEAEVLNGSFDEDDSHPLDFRTSAGIPFSQGIGLKKSAYVKDVLVQNPNGGDMIQRELNVNCDHGLKLKKLLEKTELYGHKGIRTCSIIKNCLKDEVRPLAKVHEPRLFKSYPLDKVLLNRKYFLKFKTAWTKHRFDLFHGVGINCMSTEWAKLYNVLSENSMYGCDADFGTFDGNLRAEFMDAANEVIIQTILKGGTENENIMRVLLDENVRTISVSNKTVYMDTHGNPSGSPLTTVTNCIVNLLYHWYCFIRITKYTSLTKFTSIVSFFAFGDDVIMTIKPGFNYAFDTIAEIMIGELEQKYTDAHKNLSTGLKHISELSFLKRQFNCVSNAIVLAPIEKDSIERRFNWTIMGDNDHLSHYENIIEGCMEAAAHGSTYYKYFHDKIRHGIRNSIFSRISKFKNFSLSYSDCYMDLLDRYSYA